MNCLPADLMNASRKSIGDFLKDNGLYMPNNMLSVSADSKTVKGEKLGYLTGIVYLIPDNTLCPASKMAKCDIACLVSAGRGCFNSVINGRMNKTAIYKQFPNVFYELIRRDINKLKNTAAKKGLNFCVRLNGTSDIDHMRFIASMPEVQFYDYTKMTKHLEKRGAMAGLLGNYHLTFSYSGASKPYQKHVARAIELNYNVATVFSGDLPSHFMGLPVINGDDSDLRFLDYKVYKGQAIIGLYAKGKAKKDLSGFVVHDTMANDIIARG